MKNQFEIIKSIISENEWTITDEIIESPMVVYLLEKISNMRLEINLPNKTYSIFPDDAISNKEEIIFKKHRYNKINSKYVIKTCYPQRSETIYLYLAENGEKGKKDAREFESFFSAYNYRKNIEERSGRRITNWQIEKK